MPYVTPPAIPPGTTCRGLVIPNSAHFLGVVAGALRELTRERNWEQVDGITPEEAAATCEMIIASFYEGVCGMLGTIIAYATEESPEGTLPCDGATYIATAYPELYAVLDPVYKPVPGFFQVPDLRGRTVIGVGWAFPMTNRNMGDVGGEEGHALSTLEMPAHTHSEGIALPAAVTVGLEPPVPSAVPGVGVTGIAGSGLAHENMPPFHALGYAIVAR